MKKTKTTKADLLAMLSAMPDDQFNDFAKNNNRELHQLMAWSEGIEIQAKSSFKLAHEIMNQSVLCDELAAYSNENPDNKEIAEQLALENFKLIELFNDIENKVDSFGAVVKLMEKDTLKYAALAEVIQEKTRRSKKNVELFKQRIGNLLKSINMPKVEGTFFTISLGKQSYDLAVDDFTDEQFDSLPEKFIKVKKELDKTAVKNAIIEGEIIPWASMTQKTGIVIR